MENQSTNTVFLVSPTSFGFNPETATSNVFQHHLNLSEKNIQLKAQQEWDRVCALLVKEKINVIAVIDTSIPTKPDALFPNNWMTTHADGKIIVYPLLAPNRRTEKRADIILQMKKKYVVSEIIDLSYFEKRDLFLEGTGSMVLDRQNRILYACLSARTHQEPLDHIAKILGYEVIAFHAYDHEKPIYHTNVFMALGAKWVAICMDAIPDEEEKKRLKGSFAKTGKEVIDLTKKQIDAFAGNILELESLDKKTKINMSKTAYDSLDEKQLKIFIFLKMKTRLSWPPSTIMCRT